MKLSDLTKQQAQELKRLSVAEQATFGSSRTRVQNNLVSKSLAEFVNEDGSVCAFSVYGGVGYGCTYRCRITENGKELIAGKTVEVAMPRHAVKPANDTPSTTKDLVDDLVRSHCTRRSLPFDSSLRDGIMDVVRITLTKERDVCVGIIIARSEEAYQRDYIHAASLLGLCATDIAKRTDVP